MDSTEEDGVFIDTYEPISTSSSCFLTPNPFAIQRSPSASSSESTESHVPSKMSSKLNIELSSALPVPEAALPLFPALPAQSMHVADISLLFPPYPYQIPTVGVETLNSRPGSPLIGLSPPPSPRSPACPLIPQTEVAELRRHSSPTLNTVETSGTLVTSTYPQTEVAELRQQPSPTLNTVETSGTPVTSTYAAKRKLGEVNSEALPSPRKRQRQTRNRRSIHARLPQSESVEVTAPVLVPTPSSPVHTLSPLPDIPEIEHGNESGSTTETPEWFELGISFLREEDLGEDWKALLEFWSTYERKNHFKEIRRLKTQHRPAILKEWIQQSRPNLSMWTPVISDVAQYEKDFLTWWRALQPAWRLAKNGNLTRSDGDWEPLNRPGVNGLLTVLAGLFYWGLTVQKKRAAFRNWSHAVKDVIFVMKKLVDFCS